MKLTIGIVYKLIWLGSLAAWPNSPSNSPYVGKRRAQLFYECRSMGSMAFSLSLAFLPYYFIFPTSSIWYLALISLIYKPLNFIIFSKVPSFPWKLEWPQPIYARRKWRRLTWGLPTTTTNVLQVIARRKTSSTSLRGKIMVLLCKDYMLMCMSSMCTWPCIWLMLLTLSCFMKPQQPLALFLV